MGHPAHPLPPPPLPSAEEIAAGQALLATLPLDTIPDPASTLPAPHRMPLRRNPWFVGRQPNLTALARLLKTGQQAAAITTGIGGIGKTQLASETVYRYGRFLAGGVFWLRFADPAGIPSQV